MGYPTQGQTHNLIKQLDKNLDILDNEITHIKSMLVTQTMQLNDLSKLIKSIQNTVEHDVTHR